MGPASITVIIPLHNKAPHVLRTIESLTSQTQRSEEIIVVDDASTDGGGDLLRALKLPNLKLLSRMAPGPGGYAARNLGIQEARTEWVAFLDADDAWQPDYLRAINGLIERATSDVGCVFTGYMEIFPEMRRLNAYAARQRDVHRLGFDMFVEGWLAAAECPIWTGAVAFRRSVLMDAGPFPEGRCRRGGDKDLWLRAMSKTNALCDPRPLANYYRDANNTVTKNVDMARRPCVCDTLVQMIASAHGSRAKRLKQLFNMEVRSYAFHSLRRGRVPPEIIRGYYRDEDYARWLFYRAMSLVPATPLTHLIGAQRKLKKSARRLISRSDLA